MTSIVQHSRWISTLRRRAASIALALAVIVLPAVMATTSQAGTFTLLHVFTGAPDGAYPVAGFVQDTAVRGQLGMGFCERPARACCKQKCV
jgi:hypothetical protein